MDHFLDRGKRNLTMFLVFLWINCAFNLAHPDERNTMKWSIGDMLTQDNKMLLVFIGNIVLFTWDLQMQMAQVASSD